jgi:hypothetical protein
MPIHHIDRETGKDWGCTYTWDEQCEAMDELREYGRDFENHTIDTIGALEDAMFCIRESSMDAAEKAAAQQAYEAIYASLEALFAPAHKHFQRLRSISA